MAWMPSGVVMRGLHVLVEQKPLHVEREVPVGEVDRAIAEAAGEALLELDPPPRIALLGLEERGLLRPLGDGLGTAQVLAGLGLVLCPGLRVLHEVLAQHEQQMVAVVDHHVELAVVVLLELEAVGDAGEIRLVFLGEIVERDDHLGAGGIRHRVGEVVEDVVDARLRHGLLHDLGRDIRVAERHDLELHAGQLLPLLGEIGERIVIERAQQDGELRVLEALGLDVLLGRGDGPLGDRVLRNGRRCHPEDEAQCGRKEQSHVGVLLERVSESRCSAMSRAFFSLDCLQVQHGSDGGSRQQAIRGGRWRAARGSRFSLTGV